MIPKHNVLTVITLWDAMVDIVHFGIVQGDSKERNDLVVASMVKTCQDTTNSEKQDTCYNMDLKSKSVTTQVERQQMIVLSEEKLNGVNIHRINVGSTGRLLVMVMFVYVSINSLNVQRPVKNCVKEVVHNIQTRKWQQCVQLSCMK